MDRASCEDSPSLADPAVPKWRSLQEGTQQTSLKRGISLALDFLRDWTWWNTAGCQKVEGAKSVMRGFVVPASDYCQKILEIVQKSR